MAGEERFYYSEQDFFRIFFQCVWFFFKNLFGYRRKKDHKKSQTYFSFCRYDAGQDLSSRELKEKSSLQKDNHFSVAKRALN